MRALVAAVEATSVRVRTDTLVETLVVDDARRVVGVVAKIDGAIRHLSARRGVILTAGGFINNKAMVERYAPLLRKCRFRAASDGDDGRGIRMGMGAGGAAIRMDVGCIVLPFTVPKGLLRGIFVNRRGQRFVNEDAYQTVVGERALLGENGEVFLILDDAIFERPFPPTELAAVEDTIADLERALGCPPESLQHTVAYYNAHAGKTEALKAIHYIAIARERLANKMSKEGNFEEAKKLRDGARELVAKELLPHLGNPANEQVEVLIQQLVTMMVDADMHRIENGSLA